MVLPSLGEHLNTLCQRTTIEHVFRVTLSTLRLRAIIHMSHTFRRAIGRLLLIKVMRDRAINIFAFCENPFAVVVVAVTKQKTVRVCMWKIETLADLAY